MLFFYVYMGQQLPVVKGPSEMKNDPIVMAAAAANLKNQNLKETQSKN